MGSLGGRGPGAADDKPATLRATRMVRRLLCIGA